MSKGYSLEGNKCYFNVFLMEYKVNYNCSHDNYCFLGYLFQLTTQAVRNLWKVNHVIAYHHRFLCSSIYRGFGYKRSDY